MSTMLLIGEPSKPFRCKHGRIQCVIYTCKLCLLESIPKIKKIQDHIRKTKSSNQQERHKS